MDKESNIKCEQNNDYDKQSNNQGGQKKTENKPTNSKQIQQNEHQSSNEDVESKQFIEKSFEKINKLMQEVENIKDEVQSFSGVSKEDRQYAYLYEVMVRCILQMDNMDLGGYQTVRNKRRDGIKAVQAMIKTLDDKLEENQQANALGEEQLDITSHTREMPRGSYPKQVRSTGGRKTKTISLGVWIVLGLVFGILGFGIFILVLMLLV